MQWIYVPHFSNCSWIHTGSFLKSYALYKENKKTVWKNNSIIIFLALNFAWLYELKLAVKYQKQFLIPVPPLFNCKDFIRARNQKYREIVFVYLYISYKKRNRARSHTKNLLSADYLNLGKLELMVGNKRPHKEIHAIS